MTVDARTSPLGDERSDADLLTAVRDGDSVAYGALYERHQVAAMRLARQLMRGPDADDLVAEAFTKVLVTIQNGGGPQESFRAYLLTAVRRLHVDRIRAVTRERPTDDQFELDGRVDFVDTAELGFERTTTAEAFASLPERWQMVLWHLDVEGQKPADIAPLLGMSANSVSALAYRAREGLRQAYLQKHLVPATTPDCQFAIGNLGAFVRGGLSRRDSGKVQRHVDECRSCMGLYLELQEFNHGLAGILAPAILGTAASGYLQGTGASGALAGAAGALRQGGGGGGAGGGGASAVGGSTSGVMGVLGTVGPAGIAAGAAASVVVIAGAAALMTVEPGPSIETTTQASRPGVTVLRDGEDNVLAEPPAVGPVVDPDVWTQETEEDPDAVDDPPLPDESLPDVPVPDEPLPDDLLPDEPLPEVPVPTDDPTAETPSTEPTDEPTAEPTEPTAEPSEEPTDEPTVDPTDEPTSEPTWAPTTEPTTLPTWIPTTEPTDEPTTEPTTEPTVDPTDEPTTEPTTEPT
ncbi:sigma-70 family RNA polymerase sigma factor, partial [Aeromicrobium flavum]